MLTITWAKISSNNTINTKPVYWIANTANGFASKPRPLAALKTIYQTSFSG
jgi:hypothetical protein